MAGTGLIGTTGFDWSKFLNLAIPAAATGVSGYLGYKAATGAARTQSQAAAEALEFQKQMFSQQQANLAPYLATGRASLGALMRGMGLAPFPNPGAAPGASYGQDSPFGSKLLGQLSGTAPSALKSGLRSAISGASTGASLGSVVPGIGTAIGAGIGGAAGTLSSLVGRGRKEADQLVPIQNAVGAEVDRISKAVDAARQSGTLTKEQLQEAHDTVKGLQSQFGDVAKKFGRAGPGGVATLAKYFDPLTSGWDQQLKGTAGGQASGQQAKITPDQVTAFKRIPGNENMTDDQIQGFLGTKLDPMSSTTSDGQWQFAASPTAAGAAPGATEGPESGYFTKPFTTSDFVQDPGYQARLEEGQKQLDRFFASRGLATSGGAAKSASRYGQTFASNEFQNVYNRYQQERSNQFSRLAALAGIGQTATGTSAGLGSTLAQTGAGLMTDIGAAQAAGQVGGANAISGAIAGGANMFNQAMQLRQIQNYLQSNQLPLTGRPMRSSDLQLQGPTQFLGDEE